MQQLHNYNDNALQLIKSEKRSITMFQQFKAIFINNILINSRRYLFLKEIAMIIFIVSPFILAVSSNYYTVFDKQFDLIFYSMLAMVFISRSQIILMAESRQKFNYFFKAYGMSSVVYVLTWILYTLVLGTIKYFIYIICIYICMRIFLNQIKGQSQNTNDQSIPITVERFCLLNFMTYLTTYSYSLLASSIISYNQIGLKLLIPLLFIQFIQSYQGEPSQIYSYISPTGWLFYKLSQKQTTTSYNNIIFLCQLLLPMAISIIIQLIKINRFQLIKKLLKPTQKKISQEFQMQMIQKNGILPKPLMKIINLSKKIGSKTILHNINVTINKGQIILLYGRNGSGKTTLINILTNTEYLINGIVQTNKNLKLGVSLQNNYFEDELTVKENIVFYAQLKGVSITNQQTLMDRFQLTDFCDKEYYKISGGNRKKMSIACAFLGENHLIILDEPTMGIDIMVRLQIQKIIIREQLQNRDLSIIISTCEIGLNFLQIAKRVWILQQKQLILNQSMQNIEELWQQFITIKINSVQTSKFNTFLSQIKKIRKLGIFSYPKQFILQFSRKILKEVLTIIRLYQLDKNMVISISKTSDKLKRFLKQRQKLQDKIILIQQFKQKYLITIENKPTFFSLFCASIIICYYQIIPTFIDIVYFAGILFYFLGVIFINSQKKQSISSVFYISYPFISSFIYSHIYTSYLYNKETNYEITLFQMGMKKIPYWIAHYFINLLVMTIPLIVVTVILQHSNSLELKQFLLISFCFNILLISFSYFVTLFFQINHVYKIFLPIIVTTLSSIFFNVIASSIIVYLLMIIPFILLFFITNHVVFKWRNRRKRIMGQSKGIQILIQNGIDQKLNVANIVQEKSDIFNNSLIIQNIYQKYSHRKYGIKGLNMAISRGDIFGLLGMNGSGKSTLIKMVLNEKFKTYGNIYFEGIQIETETSNIYESISISPQGNYLNEDMTVYGHLIIFCMLKGIAYKMQKPYIKALLQLFDMEDQIDRKIQCVSGGSKRKIKLITALIGKSKFLFLDEPDIGIDQQSQYVLQQMVEYISEKHKATTIIISHKIQYIERFCNKIAIIKRGTLLLIDAKKNFIAQYSRGYEIKLFGPTDQIFQQFVILMDSMFKVYEISKVYNGKIIKIAIPRERINTNTCLIDICIQFYEKGLMKGFEIREEGLQQVFKYIAFRYQQQFLNQVFANKQEKKQKLNDRR